MKNHSGLFTCSTNRYRYEREDDVDPESALKRVGEQDANLSLETLTVERQPGPPESAPKLAIQAHDAKIDILRAFHFLRRGVLN